ncbi:Oligosaccaryltransferase-domain-containing protein [Neurospora tetraspora]|uniref:Dolichyl-diphosphooligosaccharide--protein glycosyltransferase subunit 4 n=1 Tax=Neurospora tetraspora TaxID=94610 RepID=A0AAE0MRM9_9PEZI|nr:Oligosaccaryltransferase-domain-containing protein [Neurospora tetraspora]
MTDGDVPIHLALRRGPQGGKLSITTDIITFQVAVRPRCESQQVYSHLYSTERTPDTDFLCANDTMISDAELYRLAIVLGCSAMVLIVLHHFLETNAEDLETDVVKEKKAAKVAAAPAKAK